MEKIVFIGQSTSFLPAINLILATKTDIEITIISCDGHLPYDQTLLSKLILKQIKDEEEQISKKRTMEIPYLKRDICPNCGSFKELIGYGSPGTVQCKKCKYIGDVF